MAKTAFYYIYLYSFLDILVHLCKFLCLVGCAKQVHLSTTQQFISNQNSLLIICSNVSISLITLCYAKFVSKIIITFYPIKFYLIRYSLKMEFSATNLVAFHLLQGCLCLTSFCLHYKIDANISICKCLLATNYRPVSTIISVWFLIKWKSAKIRASLSTDSDLPQNIL